MSQILSAVRRTTRGRLTADYEDLDGQVTESLPSGGTIPRQLEDNYDNHMAEADEIEMTSVSVIPDDTFTVTQAVNAFGFGKFQVKLSLFTGLCWMADSMEMTILSILSPALHCDWHITRYQQALTTTIVFLGMMLSSTFWGNLSDRYGRKQALTLCAVLLFCYGLLSSLAPNFLWILFLRGLVGFAIGCVPQSVTLYAEFLPTKQRAKCVVLLDCFWALGACFEVLLALIVMPTLGWHWLLALSTIPLLAFALITPWLPESARFHVASGQPEEALATLQKVAKENGKPMLLGRLVVDDAATLTPRGRVTHLLRSELRKTSLLLWFIWIVCAFCYYGIVLMTTELFETSCADQSKAVTNLECAADCKELSTQDYVDLLWTTIAEFPGIFATVFVIERCGRKNTMAVQFVIFAVCICFLFICTENRVFLTIMLFLSRGIIAGVFQAAYVYTPEVYPTPLRAVGVGTCSAMARLGAMVTPYVAQVLMQSSLTLATSVYGLAALLAAVACFFLPIETKDREMVETVAQRS
ncbi:synaptic vesicle 2-related protein [Zootermopsis nevadensis]|uniref:Synaptic vesicle 2-related protein n=1 Tax=Zootermopsis nevadensis TaxID=136037 RepID=A0A067RC83_ZOONE|nr:synaptic vesicle 2-related protein [Zootermopsis nevadensis]XP_021923727.1 synaptic vesicle 2-related protein [Zootermopsis nevadensis]KDR17464.1 Synaptic vesicle 2-related protein [Zootermopsis nevadensis]